MTVYLVIAAHPDDPDFGVAGTAARLAREGHAVHYLMLTSGDAGSEDPMQSAEELIRVREAEQEGAGRILGLRACTSCAFRMASSSPRWSCARRSCGSMRRLQADIVLCQDPRALINEDGTYLNHPDHRAAGQAALDAAFPPPATRAHFATCSSTKALKAHKSRKCGCTSPATST